MYKMSLGKEACYRQEALDQGVLVFESERRFYDAVVAEDEGAILAAGRQVRSENYPQANAPDGAISVWKQGVVTFRSLPRRSIVVHWESDQDHLYWGVVDGGFEEVREESDEYGQLGIILHRPLDGAWRRTSIGDVSLSNLHPKARDAAVNMATVNRVLTHVDYLRALIVDEDTSAWEKRPDWVAKANSVKGGWHPKPRAMLLAERRRKLATPLVVETADLWEVDGDYWKAEIARMATTALHTAQYANGQTVLTIVKNKDIAFSTRGELEEEIAALLKVQKHQCALTGYRFREDDHNPHLRPSLDRKDSNLGYVPGNLQVVTRAANFFKSASNDEDWKLKAEAIFQMALGMQERRKSRKACKEKENAPSVS